MMIIIIRMIHKLITVYNNNNDNNNNGNDIAMVMIVIIVMTIMIMMILIITMMIMIVIIVTMMIMMIITAPACSRFRLEVCPGPVIGGRRRIQCNTACFVDSRVFFGAFQGLLRGLARATASPGAECPEQATPTDPVQYCFYLLVIPLFVYLPMNNYSHGWNAAPRVSLSEWSKKHKQAACLLVVRAAASPGAECPEHAGACGGVASGATHFDTLCWYYDDHQRVANDVTCK